MTILPDAFQIVPDIQEVPPDGTAYVCGPITDELDEPRTIDRCGVVPLKFWVAPEAAQPNPERLGAMEMISAHNVRAAGSNRCLPHTAHLFVDPSDGCLKPIACSGRNARHSIGCFYVDENGGLTGAIAFENPGHFDAIFNSAKSGTEW